MPNKPVHISIPLDLLKGIFVTLDRAADDLSFHLNREYPDVKRTVYPAAARRYDEDMKVVHDARRECTEILKVMGRDTMDDFADVAHPAEGLE